MYVQIDGEPEIGGNRMEIEVLPRALRILVPRHAHPDLFQESPHELRDVPG
jgi:diacylglycerol kinase family enzyme